MDADTVVRWGVLGLVAVAGLAAYFVAAGSDGVDETPAAAAPDPVDAVLRAEAAARPEAGPQRSAARTDAALATASAARLPADEATGLGPEVGADRPPPTPPRRRIAPPPSMAVDLPVASGPVVDEVEASGASVARTPAALPREPAGPCGGVLVRVITASSDPEWAFATIADGPGKPARIRRVGDPVASWRVDSIEWDRVWLKNGGGRCAAGINDGARDARLAVGLAPDTDGLLEAADDVAPAWQVPPDVARAIHQRSATEFVIDQRVIAKIFEQGPELLAGVEFDPVKQGDGVVGVSIDEVPMDSLLDRLGIEKGDIVLALNDSPVVSLDAAIVALGDARTRAALVASLRRGGRDFAIDVAIER